MIKLTPDDFAELIIVITGYTPMYCKYAQGKVIKRNTHIWAGSRPPSGWSREYGRETWADNHRADKGQRK